MIRASTGALAVCGLVVASCGARGVIAYPGPNEPGISLAGEAAGFAGPTESCALGGPRRMVGALVSDEAETCSALRAKTSRSSSGLFVYVAVEGTDLPPLGSYRVEDAARDCGRAADVGAELIVAGGPGGPSRRRATAGAITLTAADSARVAGTFDVALEGGGHARGPFSARVCDVDWSLFGRPRPREPLR